MSPHTNTFLPYSYDRLGVGKSDTPDGLNVVQAPLEVEIAHQLIQMLRAGKFGHFSKVVGVGHSFGSIITQAITSQYPADLGMFFSSSSSSSLSNLVRLTSPSDRRRSPHRFHGQQLRRRPLPPLS